jgi:hypothetical protein
VKLRSGAGWVGSSISNSNFLYPPDSKEIFLTRQIRETRCSDKPRGSPCVRNADSVTDSGITPTTESDVSYGEIAENLTNSLIA